MCRFLTDNSALQSFRIPDLYVTFNPVKSKLPPMKKSFYVWTAALMLLIITPACKKKKPAPDPCTTDPALSVTTDPASGSNQAAAVGPTFPLTVTINSTMPAGGVTIDVKAHQDGSSTNFYTETKTSSTKDNSFTITNTPSTVTCVVDITVTSKACATNKWTGSYRYSKK